MEPPAPTAQSRWLVLVLTVVTTLGILALLINRSERKAPPTAQGSGTPTPTWEPTSTPAFPQPIFTSEDAIARSLVLFPEGHNPHDMVARLITHRTYQQWLLAPGPADPEPTQEWMPPEFHPDHPLWLVGVLGDNLTDVDVMSLSAPQEFLPPTPSLVPGAFYAWDANSGIEAGFGTLTTQPGQDHASIVALVDEGVQIVPATEAPAIGEPTPTP